MHRTNSVNSSERKPLIVRLRNFIGDVVLMIPALERLESSGYELHCVGKGWARSLLAGHGWEVTPYPKTFSERVATLKQLRAATIDSRPRTREINAITFATSFSSAMDMRFAGLRAFGYAVEARSLLLARTAPIVYGEHAMHSYWRLAGALLKSEEPPPPWVTLKVSEAARLEARAAIAEAGIGAGYLVAVPFAGGTFEKLDKRWPHFAAWVAAASREFKRDIVLAPGPDEVEEARQRYPSAKLLPKLSIGAYAALMQEAALTISNDTGPGHIAASVGGNLLSVLGPTKREQWGALGARVDIVQSYPEWPSVDAVMNKTRHLLAESERPLQSAKC